MNSGDIPLVEDSAAAAPVSKRRRRRTLSFDAAECLHSGLRNATEQKPGATVVAAPGQQLTTSNVAEHTVLRGVPSSLPAATVGQPAPAPATGDSMMSMQLSPREFQWLALLHNRPSVEDASAMAEWMDRVMQVSDNSASLPAVTAPSVSSSGTSNPNPAASSETASSTSSSSNDPASSSSSGGSDRNSSSGESDGGDLGQQQQATVAEQHYDQEAPQARQSTGKQLHDEVGPQPEGGGPFRFERQRRRSSAWSAMSLENMSLGRMDSLFDDHDDDED
jgi:hypothetical protein